MAAEILARIEQTLRSRAKEIVDEVEQEAKSLGMDMERLLACTRGEMSVPANQEWMVCALQMGRLVLDDVNSGPQWFSTALTSLGDACYWLGHAHHELRRVSPPSGNLALREVAKTGGKAKAELVYGPIKAHAIKLATNHVATKEALQSRKSVVDAIFPQVLAFANGRLAADGGKRTVNGWLRESGMTFKPRN